MAGNNSDISRASGKPPLEHPYAALALTLALSGSQRWETAATAATAEEGGEEEEEKGDIPSASADVERKEGGRSSRGVLLEEVEEKDEELAGFGGDSSRLWSTDSEHEEESEGKQVQGVEEGQGIGDPPLASLPFLEDTDEGNTQEWLQAFENDDGSPRTDGAWETGRTIGLQHQTYQL